MISVIDTLGSIGDYPIVKAKDVEINGNTRLNTEINNKVDKVAGKGLSTNDYSATDKAKLTELSAIFTKVEE